MIRIKNWSAKRAGGRITLVGVDTLSEKPVKLVGVDLIERRSVGTVQIGQITVATFKDGTEYELV